MHASPEVAQNVVNAIARHPQTIYRESYFRFHLLSDIDKDDDKFVDCAITAGADYIVTDDSHFDRLKQNNSKYTVMRLAIPTINYHEEDVLSSEFFLLSVSATPRKWQ